MAIVYTSEFEFHIKYEIQNLIMWTIRIHSLSLTENSMYFYQFEKICI